MCLGCRACFDKGEEFCPLKDDLLPIREKLIEAEGLILASPVYVEDVNGIMKNWIDRMAFICHRPALAGKAAVTIITSGGGSTNHALRTMMSALMTWGFYVDGQYKFRTGGSMKTKEISDMYNKKIKKISKGFFAAVKNQKALNPTLYSLIVFKVQQESWQKEENYKNTIDYIYWNGKGWLEPGCIYYTNIKTSWLKVKIARLLGTMIAPFFI
jgi:multimeric flavodoxin WrbA